jgi:hypothetical protein
MTNEEFIAAAEYYRCPFFAKSDPWAATWLVRWNGTEWEESRSDKDGLDEFSPMGGISHFTLRCWELAWKDRFLFYNQPARPIAEDLYEHMRSVDP